jgi:hypothetical protein
MGQEAPPRVLQSPSVLAATDVKPLRVIRYGSGKQNRELAWCMVTVLGHLLPRQRAAKEKIDVGCS